MTIIYTMGEDAELDAAFAEYVTARAEFNRLDAAQRELLERREKLTGRMEVRLTAMGRCPPNGTVLRIEDTTITAVASPEEFFASLGTSHRGEKH